mmetsp:Transcript_14906/g.22586  ORF Transcript_14906/g.22586 Transcript_14906/m.22586 type:complete len:498 (-) Transcript_14906:53-1546(-)
MTRPAHMNISVLTVMVALAFTSKSAIAFQTPVPNNKNNNIKHRSRTSNQYVIDGKSDKQQQTQPNRRNAIQTAFKWLSVPATTAVTTLLPGNGVMSSASAATMATSRGKEESPLKRLADASSNPSSGFTIYEVIPDASEALSPTIKAVKPQKFCKHISLCDEKFLSASEKGGAIWLGEHHNSKKDHDLQVQFIRSIYDMRKENYMKSLGSGSGTASDAGLPPMSIGLEQIQVQFQPLLDEYVAGTLSEEMMLSYVQWEKRWSWSFDNYRPVFELARELKIPLIALNVNSEDLAVVEENGIAGLSKEQIRRYIKDPRGFGEFAKPLSYRAYISYVIEPSYDLHQQIGLLRTTMSGKQLSEDMPFRNFFSGRILWDEAMAGNAYDWNLKNPGGLMVGIVGLDHVKFEKGIPGRYSRLVADQRDSVSVLLNPTLIDTRPSGSVSNYANAASSAYPDQITLQLRYLKDGIDMTSSEMRNSPSSTGGVLSLADYIVVSNTDA